MPAHGTSRWKSVLALGAGLLVGVWSSHAVAVEKDLTAKGQVLVKENCAQCHAIGKEGDSPHKDAPPFRILSKKYPVTDLAESLAEGIVSGHPDMPIFVFSPQDVEAIIGYLESIQDVPSPPAEELAPPE
jgi:mono/diheme cytochrome c family protein